MPSIKLKKGMQFGEWTVIERDFNPTSKQHSTFWFCECGICKKIYSVSRDSLIRGQSGCCNHCKGKKIKEKLKELGYSIIDERIPIGTRFGLLTTKTLSYYRNDRDKNKKYIKCICDCGKEIEVRVDHLEGRMKNGIFTQTISCGCKNISNGELKIKKILDDAKITYKQQYKIKEFDTLKSFDFALFDKDGKLIKLIEYDGEQHFFPVEAFGGEEKFKIQQQRDASKDEYCRTHNIFLQRIPYYDFNRINPKYLGLE